MVQLLDSDYILLFLASVKILQAKQGFQKQSSNSKAFKINPIDTSVEPIIT